MKILKKVLSLLLCLIMCVMTMVTGSVCSFAEDSDYEETGIEHRLEIGDNTLVYTIENDEITIVRCEGESYDVLEIPKTIEGYPVATIGSDAFSECLNFSIKIPDTVTEIKYDAFFCVLNVEYNGNAYGSPWGAACINGYIEDGMLYTDSSKEIFIGCSYDKTKIVIPKSVENISNNYINGYDGYVLLSNRPNLQYIEVNEDNEYYASVDGVLFNKSKTSLIKYPEGKKDIAYIVPDSVTEIVSANKCQNLQKIVLGDNLKVIETGAFSYCNSLTEINFSPSLNAIYSGAFYRCNSLTEISLPDSLLTLESGAFMDCTNLKSIKLGSRLKHISCNVFESTAYHNDQNNWTKEGLLYIDKYLISADFCAENYVEIREGTELIAEGLFGNNDNLIEISLPDSIKNIGAFAFEGCVNLKIIKLGSELELIGERAFSKCPNIQSYKMNNFSEKFYIDDAGALLEKNYCRYDDDKVGLRLISYPCSSSAKTYTISKDVVSIEDAAFTGCSNLKEIRVEDGNPVYITDGIALFSFRPESASLDSVLVKNQRYTVPKTITINGAELPVSYICDTGIANPENPTILDVPKDIYWIDSSDYTPVAPNYIFYEGTQEEWENSHAGYYYDRTDTIIIYEAYGKDLEEVLKEHPEIKPEDHEITITENDSSNTGIIATTMNTTFNEPVQIAVNEAFTKAERTQISAVIQDKDAVVYNIALVNSAGGAITNLNGGTVTLKVPESLIGENIKGLNVYHITHDNKTELFSTKNNSISIEYIDGKKYFCFDITNWSPFIFEVTETDEEDPTPTEKVFVDCIRDSISLNYKSGEYLEVAYGPADRDYAVKYESSNPKVASVDGNGKITANKRGSATITCTITDSNGNTASDTCEVKVTYTWWQWLIKIILFGWIWY